MDALSQFQEEKLQLLEKALTGINQLTTNLDSLNRNLETINTIGSQFKPPAHLWSSFHEAIAITEPATKEAETEQKEQLKESE